MKHKTSDLSGALLDAAVAKAEGLRFSEDDMRLLSGNGLLWSRSWMKGGPIIERERISLTIFADVTRAEAGGDWDGVDMLDVKACEFGPTPLIAAMRAYVASKLGEEVDLP